MTRKASPPEEISLTLGSKYRVLSLGSREEVITSRGTFKGIVSIGTIDGMAIELDDSHEDMKGKLRVIPSHVVLAVDILEAAAREEAAKEDLNVHYT